MSSDDPVPLDRTPTTLASFFYERVTAARRATGADLSDEVEHYAVSLLTRFAVEGQVQGRTAPPLALQFMQARESGVVAMRAVGDRALFIAGVLRRSMRRSLVGADYVESLGAAAYRAVAAVPRTPIVFDELARSFDTVTDVLGEATAPEPANDPTSLLEVYQRWCGARDVADARRLRRAGVTLDGRGERSTH